MADWVRILDQSSLAPGEGTMVRVDAHEIAVFRLDGRWQAMSGRCPHQGASLGNATLNGNCVTCPLHRWEFDLSTGEAIGRSTHRVELFEVRAEGDGVWIDRETLPSTNSDDGGDGIHRYLVRYAAPGWVGVFGTVDELIVNHRDLVVVRTSRGEELGEVLSSETASEARTGSAKPNGEMLRHATNEEVATHRRRSTAAVELLIGQAQRELDHQRADVQIIDGELLFDGSRAVLYYLGEASPVLTDLRERLAELAGISDVEWSSLIEPESAASGCGKTGCGEGGCHASSTAGQNADGFAKTDSNSCDDR